MTQFQLGIFFNNSIDFPRSSRYSVVIALTPQGVNLPLKPSQQALILILYIHIQIQKEVALTLDRILCELVLQVLETLFEPRQCTVHGDHHHSTVYQTLIQILQDDFKTINPITKMKYEQCYNASKICAVVYICSKLLDIYLLILTYIQLLICFKQTF